MDRFPALRLILRLGRIGPAVLALSAAGSLIALYWAVWGWLVIPLAFGVLVFVYFLGKSYVEIVQIISEMAH